MVHSEGMTTGEAVISPAVGINKHSQSTSKNRFVVARENISSGSLTVADLEFGKAKYQSGRRSSLSSPRISAGTSIVLARQASRLITSPSRTNEPARSRSREMSRYRCTSDQPQPCNHAGSASQVNVRLVGSVGLLRAPFQYGREHGPGFRNPP